jgi:hypothetical protein
MFFNNIISMFLWKSLICIINYFLNLFRIDIILRWILLWNTNIWFLFNIICRVVRWLLTILFLSLNKFNFPNNLLVIGRQLVQIILILRLFINNIWKIDKLSRSKIDHTRECSLRLSHFDVLSTFTIISWWWWYIH